MYNVHLNIGSNQGDRRTFIARAIALIGDKVGKVTACSREVESDAWGYESSNRFLNVGVNVSTALGPMELLLALQGIEREISSMAHRNADGSYRDREVDIDIIFYGTERIEMPGLIIPHPRWRDREFVTVPAREICPELVAPSGRGSGE